MRISIITSPFGELPPIAVGAVEKLFHLLAVEWTKMDYKVCFVCAGGGDCSSIEYRRIKKHVRTGSTKKDLIWDFLYSVKAILACPQTDILVCNTFWSPVLAPLMRWKYRKLIYGVHRFPKRQYFLYPFVHKFICVSSAVAEALKKQVSAKRVCVVVNPIDTEVFKSEPRQIVKGRVMYAGRIHPLKGIRCLAEACGELYAKELVRELVLVGPYESGKGGGGDSFLQEIKHCIGGCPLVLKGSISDPRELAGIERTAEVFVYPSEDVTGEAFGIAPLEAMALGVPTVVSELKCFDEFVRDGENALKVRVGDVKGLECAIRRLVVDEKLQCQLGQSASEGAKRYSLHNVAAEYVHEFVVLG